MNEVDELNILARCVLLDALTALGSHRNAVVLVGAQAVYLRVGEADLAVAPFTSDGDLEVAVDLLVPASVSPGTGRRAARLPGHDARVARIVKGLEGALIDYDVMSVGALDAQDPRVFDVRVAGPAALLVAKAHKISDRQGTMRENDKDALDVLRLLRGTETVDLATRYRRLLTDARSREVAMAARSLFEDQFGTRRSIGVQMAVRSVGPLADADEIAVSCEMLAGDLLSALKG